MNFLLTNYFVVYCQNVHVLKVNMEEGVLKMETVQQNVSQNTPNFSAPVGQLKTNRGLAKYILL